MESCLNCTSVLFCFDSEDGVWREASSLCWLGYLSKSYVYLLIGELK